MRTVVTDFDLSADVVSVADAAHGWKVIVRTRSNRIVRVHVLVAKPRAIRAAITHALAHA